MPDNVGGSPSLADFASRAGDPNQSDRIRDGLLALDRLAGISRGGLGQPRHQVTAQISYRRAGIGATVEAPWRSASRISIGATDLHFSSSGTINLRLFADLGQIGGLQRQAS